MRVSRSSFVDNVAYIGPGAIDNQSEGELSVSDSNFIGNSGHFAGAISNAGELNIEDTKFKLNRADFGGAIACRGASHVYNSAFDANTAQDGGAILSSGTLWVVDSVFTINSAAKNGGAIRNIGRLSVRKTTFTNNQADLGGAIDNNEDATLGVDDSVFIENLAWIFGGAIRNEGTLRISNSAFTRNSAVDYYEFHDLPKPKPRKHYYSGARIGGAIASFKSFGVVNSVFSENTADGGAAILIGEAFNSAVDADLIHLTLVRNSADHAEGLLSHQPQTPE